MISVSIIIPVYNVAPYIKDCLNSVCAQSYSGPLECILVDDCGTDESMEIVNQYLSGYKGSVIFRTARHNRNRGLSAARNTGLEICKGDYVYFLDSDDEITPDCIQKLTEPLGEELYDVVIGKIEPIGGIMKLAFPFNARVLKEDQILHSYSQHQWCMMAQNKLCRKEFLMKTNLRFEEGLIHEDELWSAQLSCVAKTMRFVSDGTYIYKIREGGITANSKHYKKASALCIAHKCFVSFSDEKGLSRKKDVHNIAQNLLAQTLLLVVSDRVQFKEIYTMLRKSAKMKRMDHILLNGSNIRHQVRDFHFLLPIHIAWRWEMFLISHIN